ncbi:MAG: FMN-binding protein [Desulfobacterales bacterium]|nr:FMN-binding protein [Desulfobacterales bacterium]
MERALKKGSAGPADRLRNSNFAQAWLILVLALIFGAALAAVQVNFSGVIAANKLNETLDRIPELVWGAAKAAGMASQNASVDITPGTVTVKKELKTSYYNLFRVTHEGKLAGWVVKADGQGYADKIEIIIGLDPSADTITGLFVLQQKETPGLGNKIAFPEWRNQFMRKKTSTPLVVTKGQSQAPSAIDAVTGATISSRSVIGIVNRTISDVKGRLTPATIRFYERQS